MKDKLSPEQSQRLIELGVDPSNASESCIVCKEPYLGAPNRFCNDVKVPIFTLTDILALLPKELDDNVLAIIAAQLVVETDDITDGWTATYVAEDMISAYGEESICSAPELIDALFELLVWCITNKHLKV